MTARFCIICGRFGSLQFHHLAGRVYAPRLGAWACRRCHTYLHGRLAAGGIDLRHATDEPAVRAWAVLRGVSETMAAALVMLNERPAAGLLRARAREVGLVLVSMAPACEALSPRPLLGRGCPAPVHAWKESAPRPDHAAGLLALAHRSANAFNQPRSHHG
jgi:hypothetical protein